MSARERILARVREALEGRDRMAHPGDFGGWRPATEGAAGSVFGGDDGASPEVAAFAELLTAAGGEAVLLRDLGHASRWITDFAAPFERVCFGEGVPAALRPAREPVEPAHAELGLSMARGAVAETGSLVLGAEDGRRAQLLAPVHVVFVRAEDVHETLRGALAGLHRELPSAIGLHSGPSKSADIGQVMVRGVHGPGRLVAAIVGSG